MFARLNAKVLNPSRIASDASSQIGALCISPSTRAYKLTRLLQAAIYGGVFEAECYVITSVWKTPAGQKPVPVRQRVAVKIMLRHLEAEHRQSLQESITAEMQFAPSMRGHKNILSYEELWESKSRGTIFVVMPFADHEDLFEVLRKRHTPFGEPEARWLFRQLIDGARYLHSYGIAFRDHSLENVLIFRSTENAKDKENAQASSSPDVYQICPKITDPGQATTFQLDRAGNVVELRASKLFGKSFRPPEVYLEPKIYDPIKVDVFCLGWMLFFAVTKRQPFDRALDSDQHWYMLRTGKFNELLKAKGNVKLSPELQDLLTLMLSADRKKRPDPRRCLAHPWFTDGPHCPIYSSSLYSSSTARGSPPKSSRPHT